MSHVTGGPGRPTIPADVVWGVPWRWDDAEGCYRPDLPGEWPFFVAAMPRHTGWSAVRVAGPEVVGNWYGPDGACCELAAEVKALAAERGIEVAA